MSNLKDVVKKDTELFLNLDEFSDIHDINGKEMLVIVDNDLLKDRPRQSVEAYHAASGVYVAEKVIFVRESDLGYTPVIDQKFYLDGNLHMVTGCNSQMGILEITLTANES